MHGENLQVWGGRNVTSGEAVGGGLVAERMGRQE